MNDIKALTVLDGRYKRVTKDLNDIFSEYGLIKYRTVVEINWLIFILKELKFANAGKEDFAKIESVLTDFNEQSALRVKEIESETNHDVKAVEYYIKEELERKGLGGIKEWVHFACTSDDINNTAYALMLKEGKEYISGNLAELLKKLEELAILNKKIPMMSRTHGQPASPTTVGKEFINFAHRIRVENDNLNQVVIEGKMNGATGNYNAHYFAFPDIDWIKASRNFIKDYLKIEPLTLTTQINPNNYISKMLHTLIRSASIMIDLDRDMWGYISHGYFKQITKKGEVGSSTMPHKVNPIDFENSEGNLGLAISMMEHVSVKLLNSRFQRDLTDSTVLRNMGTLFGYFLIGIKSTMRGLGKIKTNKDMLLEDLQKNPELLAEPIQTVMRVYEEENPYEKLKELTRGVKITQEVLENFIDSLEKVPSEVKDRMKALTPETYIGLAEQLVDEYFKENNIVIE
jgi:adenylosuccinate lyase